MGIRLENTILRNLLDGLPQIAVGRRDDSHIHAHRLLAADAGQGILLQDVQQHPLRLQRQIADLIQKERAAIGQFKAPKLTARRAGKGPFLVAE